MALIDDIFKGSTVQGLAIGIGVTILAPVVVPAVTAVLRPLAKGAIKTGIIGYEKGREIAVGAGSSVGSFYSKAKAEVDDLVATARAELEEGKGQLMEEKKEAAEKNNGGKKKSSSK